MTRLVSRAACKELAQKLTKIDFDCKTLRELLGLEGPSADSLQECIETAAKENKLSRQNLDRIEKETKGAIPEEFKKLRVKMEFAPPEQPLLQAADLDGLKSLAARARVHKEPCLTRLRTALDPELKEHSAIALDEPDEVRAWFDAANRQVLEPGDEPWMLGLLELVVRESADNDARQRLTRVLELLKSKKEQQEQPPWDLSELDETAPVAPARPPSVRSTGSAEPAKVGLALAIGVGKYLKADDTSATGFINLRCAAKDAQDVAAYLSSHEDIDFTGRVQCLVDEQATLRRIMHELDALRAGCPTEGDPLVLVYFSGHGMPDHAGRHYLVPHDGDPGDLFSTALWNRTFNAALEQIPTQRLVVLLDACHAQAMSPPGAKDGSSLLYDPRDASDGLRLEPGRGRYFIASCAAGQRSFEADGNGVFTQALLSLLRFEDVQKEQLDLADLYCELRARVDAAARRIAPKLGQSPTANVPEKEPTGIILAVNRRREYRLRQFVESVQRHLKDRKPSKWATIQARLTDLVDGSLPAGQAGGYEVFCSLVTDAADLSQGNPDERCIVDLCRDLARQLEVTMQGDTRRESGPVDKVSTTPRGLDLGAGRSPAVASAYSAQARRRLAPDAVQGIVDSLPQETEYLATVRRLKLLLSRPEGVSESEFIQALKDEPERILESFGMVVDADPEKQERLQELRPGVEDLITALAIRIKKAWKEAQPAHQPLSMIAIRSGRGT